MERQAESLNSRQAELDEFQVRLGASNRRGRRAVVAVGGAMAHDLWGDPSILIRAFVIASAARTHSADEGGLRPIQYGGSAACQHQERGV